MKITGKISTTIFLLGLLCIVCTVPLVIFGLPELLNAYRLRGVAAVNDWLVVIGLGGLLLGFLFSVLALIRIVHLVVRPVRDASAFADRLANGEYPARLSEKGMTNNEIQTLFTALNLLRDRQQNLNSKLKLSLAREAELRRGAEAHSQLQLRIIARMLPEMRTPLGSIKGFSRILMLDLDSEKADRAEMHRLLDEICHRVGSLSRQIERLYDIALLDRERWTRSEAVEFDTAEFMRELAAFNQIALQEREVTLVNRFSASAPERLILDRELLQQLLIIMILAVGRAAAPGETLVLSCLREEGRVVFEVRDSKHAPLREPLAEPYRAFEASADPEGLAAESQSIPILGLVFARDLAARLGGSLRVGSSAEAGAVLRFDLSDGCVVKSSEFRHGRSTSARVEFPRVGSRREEGERRGSETPVRVLHGSDVADAPYLLRRLLGPENIEVDSFRNASELVERAKGGQYDCLILSPTLKNCELRTLIEELRQASGRRDLPTVVICSMLSDGLRRELEMLDRVFLMNVPVNFALLGRIIHETAGSRFQ